MLAETLWLRSDLREREASMTLQMPYEPLPASVLFALVSALVVISPINQEAVGVDLVEAPLKSRS